MSMRLSPRADLGGYASGLDTLAALAGVEIEKPFVLLCGPNGSGKTGLLRMLRAATGLTGERSGHLRDGFGGPPDPEDCGGDLGKLAAYERSFGGTGRPRDLAGVLDAEALGWRGQRTWLFNARAENTMLTQGHFDDGDFTHHVAMLTSGANRKSHGQFLVNPWLNAIRFGLGILDGEDPYDAPGRLPPAMAEMARRLFPDGRSEERWLLLDEPETALDAEALYVGLSALVEAAEPGRLRVFCASHSPLFAAGLADAPSVQVLDLGGKRPWLGMQRRTLAEVADRAKVEDTGRRLAQGLRDQHARAVAEAREERDRESAALASELNKAARDLVLEIHAAGPEGLSVPRGSRKGGAVSDLGLMRPALVSRPAGDAGVRLTREGRDLAEHLAAKAAKPPRRRKPARETEPPAP